MIQSNQDSDIAIAVQTPVSRKERQGVSLMSDRDRRGHKEKSQENLAQAHKKWYYPQF